MVYNPAEVLRLLLAIPQKQIRHDIADGERDFDRLMETAVASHQTKQGSEDPELFAKSFHWQLVRANVLQQRDDIPAEVRLFYAAKPADIIAEQACDIAHEKGKLAKLSSGMDEIGRRDGLAEDQYWPLGEGPDDYQAFSAESDELFEQVRATVFVTILRRYYLNAIANLFENDREEFDQKLEAGRKLIFENGAAT